MQRQVTSWRQTQITDAQAKLIFYSAFVDGKLDAPKSLLPEVHRFYFEPQNAEFSPRTIRNPSDALTKSGTLIVRLSVCHASIRRETNAISAAKQ